MRVAQAFETFSSSCDGLSTPETKPRLAEYGPYRLPKAKPCGPLIGTASIDAAIRACSMSRFGWGALDYLKPKVHFETSWVDEVIPELGPVNTN